MERRVKSPTAAGVAEHTCNPGDCGAEAHHRAPREDTLATEHVQSWWAGAPKEPHLGQRPWSSWESQPQPGTLCAPASTRGPRGSRPGRLCPCQAASPGNCSFSSHFSSIKGHRSLQSLRAEPQPEHASLSARRASPQAGDAHGAPGLAPEDLEGHRPRRWRLPKRPAYQQFWRTRDSAPRGRREKTSTAPFEATFPSGPQVT